MITVETTVNATPEKAWEIWTAPEHIVHWNNASPDWHTPKATNDLRVGGTFCSTMAARDGSFSFDFEGTYTAIEAYSRIAYTIADGRKVTVSFEKRATGTHITENFEPENQNSEALQQQGWQAILDNFKNYIEQLK